MFGYFETKENRDNVVKTAPKQADAPELHDELDAPSSNIKHVERKFITYYCCKLYYKIEVLGPAGMLSGSS